MPELECFPELVFSRVLEWSFVISLGTIKICERENARSSTNKNIFIQQKLGDEGRDSPYL
jgi:hypothetical protein